ncbi:LDCC motif putative metal-binding protein [Thermosediminibacter litoriperuensis]|uniref:Uncharacterized protein n=1 Tax=Thermosediminibacter litoriperuensis TaxID=291989 RepID=A0A5S5AWA1_9FIRM|nr:LDCC motif putative metal-binding protein [Thermosediminibacter litoriperuensis]TYP57631.1 hypothetical protein LZ11_00624 [Thermosediminibacter litoriperuensis]
MAGWLSRFLENLAKANEKTFRGKKMDCCELHRDQEKRPVSIKNKK